MSDRLLLVLAAVAGSIDGASYLGLGHVFTGNMTGNTVLLGLAAGHDDRAFAVAVALTAAAR